MWSPSSFKTTNNIYIVLIIFVIPNFTLSCGNHHNDLQDYNLRGKVKSVRETSYKAFDKFGEIQKGDITDEYNLFNNYYALYNTKGNLLTEIEYKIDGSIDYKSTYLYDKNDRVSEIIGINNDGSQDKWVSKYDESGYLVEDNWYEDDGGLYLKYLYANDNKGNALSQSCYSDDGTMKSKYIHKYDLEDNLTERKEYNSLGQIILEQKYVYDETGNRIESIYKRSNYYNMSLSSYDTKNNVIEEIDYS